MGAGASNNNKAKKGGKKNEEIEGEEEFDDNQLRRAGNGADFSSPDLSEHNYGASNHNDAGKEKPKALDNLLQNILVSPPKKANNYKFDSSKLMPSQIWVEYSKQGSPKIQF